MPIASTVYLGLMIQMTLDRYHEALQRDPTIAEMIEEVGPAILITENPDQEDFLLLGRAETEFMDGWDPCKPLIKKSELHTYAHVARKIYVRKTPRSKNNHPRRNYARG